MLDIYIDMDWVTTKLVVHLFSSVKSSSGGPANSGFLQQMLICSTVTGSEHRAL